MDRIAEYLATTPLRTGTLVLDGALATELEARGADLHDALWSAKVLIEDPAMIRDVHRDYLLAGADIVTTATYQASFDGFARRGIDSAQSSRLMRGAVALACEARDRFWSDPALRANRLRPLVAASVGPYGAVLADGSEYRGHYAISDAGLREFHAPRLELLASSGADLLAIETVPSLREALVLAELVEELAALPAWIAFSCADEAHTCEGQDIGDCAAALQSLRWIGAIGVNCTAPGLMVRLVQRMRARSAKPLLVYPNSGEGYDAGTKRWVGEPDASRFASSALAWRAAGASLIGGCCRSTPAEIRAVRAALG
jgi:homocysteine S-methyltransferase